MVSIRVISRRRVFRQAVRLWGYTPRSHNPAWGAFGLGLFVVYWIRPELRESRRFREGGAR